MICSIPITPFQKMPLAVAMNVSAKGKYWKSGEVITIYIEGGKSEWKLIESVLHEINCICNLSFRRVSKRQNADIRIGFDPNDGNYSAVGTDALYFSPDKNTMNIAEQYPYVVRHEMGHAIGLLHEMKHPKIAEEFIPDVVIKDLAGPPNFWSEERSRHNVLDPPDPSTINLLSYDPDSVMNYFYPGEWVRSGVPGRLNKHFSSGDKKMLRSMYRGDKIGVTKRKFLYAISEFFKT